jgi:ATP dependent DNA ligase domain
LHEVKYDGYRLRLERDGDRVRLITRGGYNWTSRYPWIVEAALKNHHKQFVIEVSNPSVGEHPHGGSPDRGPPVPPWQPIGRQPPSSLSPSSSVPPEMQKGDAELAPPS